MLAVGALEHNPDARRRGAARGALVESLPLHRLSEHPQGGARGGRKRCGDGARSAQSRPAAGGPAAAHRQGRFAADINFRRPAPHARRALAGRAWRHSSRSTPRRRCALPGVVAVWTAADVADLPPIDFRQVARCQAWSPIASRCWPRRPCAMSASRWRSSLPKIPISPRTQPSSCSAEIEELPRCLDPTAPPAAFDDGPRPRSARSPQGLRRCRRRLRRCAHGGRARRSRSAGTAGRRSRPAAPSRAANAATASWRSTARPRCRTINRDALAAHARSADRHGCTSTRGMSAAASAFAASSIPRMCSSALAALRLGRPVKWIEDRREHLMAANHSRDQVHRIRAAVDRATASSSRSMTSSGSTRAPISAPMAPRCPI